ncbi:hypothetical protein [Haliea sp. E17]|uniref:hypothetical protein n=1 Tax=Haliea sp. E17 TaxID=3401576 RepID=UPI003AB0537A
MSQLSPSTLRTLAAFAATGLGAAMVASLWLRPLDATAIWLLSQGWVYLLIALGLFGKDRFTLYVGIAAPVIFFALRPEHTADQLPVADLLALLGDSTIATLCATVVWRLHYLSSTAGNREQQAEGDSQVG